LATLLLAGLSAACMNDPLAGTSPPDDAGVTPGAGTVATTTGGGGTTTPTGGTGGTTASTTIEVLSSPDRAVDILFMVDNSPSMDPKQAALAQNFPRLIQALQTLPGGLSDVHIGVISSDMGAGSEGIGGNCDVPLGDRGLLWGNDPTPGARATVAGAPNNGCGLYLGARWIEDVQNATGVGRLRNYTGNLTDVFSCLARAVGVNGCGYEHQLQSIRVALNPQAGVNDANNGFLRPKAKLAIILVTDEDDCSANPNDTDNDSMFLQRPPGQTASLKCAARGHVCNGKPIPNYDPVNGYTGTGFSTSLANCAPKEPRDPAYLPLIGVQEMVDWVNRVKARPTEQILVSGIFGWPANNDPSTVLYQIGKDATSLPPPQNTYWDYMPICSVPTQMAADGNIYKAYGGLRLKKFIDGFGANGQTFSICNSDFSNAMTQVGDVIAQTMTTGCFPYPLADTDPTTPDIQPECQVVDKISCDNPGTGDCLVSGYQEQRLPECMDGGIPLNPATPQTNNIPDSVRPCWYLSYDTASFTGCSGAPNGQKISALRRTGTVAPAGSLLALTCLTCPASNPDCTAASH
jgi:hypothetical protein